MFNFYLLITYFLFCILTSCTHYMQIFAKSSTWEYRVEFEEKCLEVVNSSDFYFQFVKSLKIWEKKVFKIFWECSCALHIIKIAFQLFFYKTSRIIGLIDRSWSSTDRKCPIFRPKVSVWFDLYLIDPWSVEIFYLTLSIAARFLLTDRNSKFSNF